MAKKKDRATLDELTPNSKTIVVSGKEVRMAADKFENALMNMLLACQMRSMIQNTIQKYHEQEATLTPKELADLSKAAREVAEFSSGAYSVDGASVGGPSTPKESEIDFSKLKPVNAIDINEASGPDTGKPSPGPEGTKDEAPGKTP